MAGETPSGTPTPGEYGTLYVVGIGPGLPHAMTQRAKDVIRTADCVIASNLYQEFLQRDGTLPPESAEVGATADGGTAAEGGTTSEGGTLLERPDGSRQELVRSTMGRQVELAREAFERVRDGEDVAHVSGGDPNVYGKSDLMFVMAREDEATEDRKSVV